MENLFMMQYNNGSQQNFLQLDNQKVASKLRTYEEAYNEVKSDHPGLQTSPPTLHVLREITSF